MASSPIMANRWGNNGNSDRLYLLGLQNHSRWWLQPWNEKTLNGILKIRDITFPTKIHIVKAIVFPVIMYGCESWTMKKAEHWRIGAFELWCWRRLLRVPWTAKRSNQSILKGINLDNSLKGLMLKLQYFGYLMRKLTRWKRPWCSERLNAGGERDYRGWDGWMALLTHGHEPQQVLGDGEGQGSLACCSPRGRKSQTWLNNWMNDNDDLLQGKNTN